MFRRGLMIAAALLLFTGAAKAQEAAQIDWFLTSTAGYVPGDWLTISWQVSGVDLALLEVYDPGAGDFPIQLLELPKQGSRRIFVPTTAVNGLRLRLWAVNRPNFYSPVTMYQHISSAWRELSPAPPCRPRFYLSDADYAECPVMTQTQFPAAYQPFENGFLLWRSDTGDVWVIVRDGTATSYAANSYGALPDNPAAAPAPSGYSTPINGFGKVWGNSRSVREALGWALGGEVAYTMTLQTEAVPSRVSYFYMTLPDGQVMRVENGYWALEPAE